jgi:hypothetical protein
LTARAFAERAGSLLVIAHRISSARRAHRILVLDGTRAVLGTHQQLLESSPQYADLAGSWEPAVSAAAGEIGGGYLSRPLRGSVGGQSLAASVGRPPAAGVGVA